ncbi:MAG: hypothetical protein HXY40_14350 [Chloroflexi bacterium]|nr:hypothetical protein [Chloroflexota bacterium]
MPFRDIEQGIAAIQAGKKEEGARLLRIALRNELVTGNVRAVTLIWLAETSDDRQFKIGCYNDALLAEPGNEQAKQRLGILLAATLPPAPAAPAAPAYPAPSAPQPAPPPRYSESGYPASVATTMPITPQPANSAQAAQHSAYRVCAVIGGPNGAGSGFFITRDGLLATTRYVVGSAETVTIEVEAGRQVSGRVVRSYSEMDLAFVMLVAPMTTEVMPITSAAQVADNTTLVALTASGQRLTGRQRPTKRLLAPHWFPTTIEKLIDAGGNPVFDDRNYLVGMLTRNSSRSSQHLFGLHINAILRALEYYVNELRADANRVYCPACGGLSRAPSVRGFYCEYCGTVLPHASEITRFPVAQADTLYGENNVSACPHCGSRSGIYGDRCLRCGGTVKI